MVDGNRRRTARDRARLRARVLGGVLVPVLAAGCGRSAPTIEPSEGVVVVEGGACGDVTFWAVNDERDVVVRVMVPALARSAAEPTEIGFSLPNRGVFVEAIHGVDLPNHCAHSDAYLSGVRYSSARAGSGTMSLGARRDFDSPQCGTTGTVRIDGLVTDDGTAFAPFSISAENVGCYEQDEGAGALGTVTS